MSNLAERLAGTRASISDECTRLDRSEPTLIVVTKNHPVTLVQQLFDLGERNFGENRVQEALEKANEFNGKLQYQNLNWHLVGQLQTNKVKQALGFASTIHSLDRQPLLSEIVKRSAERASPLDVFIQVNLTGDEQRGGVAQSELLGFADQVASAQNLNLLGLMAVASLGNDPKVDFERVAILSEQLCKNHERASNLSIGMSGDYLEALQFGATHLRIGNAITGNRQY